MTLALAAMLWPPQAAAQDDSRLFVGALAGVSALSGDARSETTAAAAAVSLYDPGLGPAVNVFAGAHLAQYVSVQANWIWNRNDLQLVSTSTAPPGVFYVQQRNSRQNAVVFDGLIYFRRLNSVIRPYLGTGLSVVRFSSYQTAASVVGDLIPPPPLVSTRLGLRSHVGIDVRLSRRLQFRYSFSETISGNPISPSLTPPGRRGLMNFQNLFGLVGRF